MLPSWWLHTELMTFEAYFVGGAERNYVEYSFCFLQDPRDEKSKKKQIRWDEMEREKGKSLKMLWGIKEK